MDIDLTNLEEIIDKFIDIGSINPITVEELELAIRRFAEVARLAGETPDIPNEKSDLKFFDAN